MNVGDTITAEPTAKGVILRDRGGDYWAWGRQRGTSQQMWNCFASAGAARRYASRAATAPNDPSSWGSATTYQPLTVFELGEANASPRYTNGQVITEDPLDANVILYAARNGDYLVNNGEGGWDYYSTLERARASAGSSIGMDFSDFREVTFVEYVKEPNAPADVKPEDIKDLNAYKAFVRDKVIAEATAQGWCDRVGGWLKEIGLEPRPVELPAGIGSAVRLKDGLGLVVRILPPTSTTRYQWVCVTQDGSAVVSTLWVQEQAERVESMRSMS